MTECGKVYIYIQTVKIPLGLLSVDRHRVDGACVKLILDCRVRLDCGRHHAVLLQHGLACWGSRRATRLVRPCE